MKYIALLSGGKDSCFNLLHCSKNGHQLIAAASLGPVPGREELDSYLYQTVGQDAIQYVADALETPLYRRFISGQAVEQGPEYGSKDPSHSKGVEGDETEDLYELLLDVKSRHPDAEAVSVGAILSNYQRVRVEDVCNRLSLVPLCYLWQRDQRELLSEMIEAGVEAIIIKVAGIGLKQIHLGKSLAEMQPTLEKLNDLYGSHICGEGGEYESLTLDCPLFKRRISLNMTEVVVHSDNDFAIVAYLRIKDAVLKQKSLSQHAEIQSPPLFSDEMEALRLALQISQLSTTELHPVASVRSVGSWIAIGGIQSDKSPSLSQSFQEEVQECFRILQEKLDASNLSYANIAFMNVYLSSTDSFSELNRVYKNYFGISPPARACVAVELPPHIRIRMDCVASTSSIPSERHALHVQGLSYWAPANIGPYSQSILVYGWGFISGQIGMLPSSLSMPTPPSFAMETALSAQHVANVSKATFNDELPIPQSTLVWITEISNMRLLKENLQIIKMIQSAPTLFIGARSLPKDALIEMQVIMHTGRYPCIDDDGIETIADDTHSDLHGMLTSNACRCKWYMRLFTKSGAFCAIVAVKGDPLNSMIEDLKRQHPFDAVTSDSVSVRIFHSTSADDDGTQFAKSLFATHATPAITLVPVRFIATPEVNGWDYALCILGTLQKTDK